MATVPVVGLVTRLIVTILVATIPVVSKPVAVTIPVATAPVVSIPVAVAKPVGTVPEVIIPEATLPVVSIPVVGLATTPVVYHISGDRTRGKRTGSSSQTGIYHSRGKHTCGNS